MIERKGTKGGILDEGLERLLGRRGKKEDRAVRVGEIDAYITAAIEADRKSEADKSAGVATGGPIIANFRRIAGLLPGNFRWRVGASKDPPPDGYFGAAHLMKRGDGVGFWLAAMLDGARGDNEPRLFMSGTSGQPDDWGPWREIYGAQEITGANVSGFKIGPWMLLYRTGLTIEFENATTLLATWTFEEEFTETPFVVPVLSTGGTFTGLSNDDIAGHSVGPTATNATIRFKKDDGAADFASGDSVTNVRALAIGRYR